MTNLSVAPAGISADMLADSLMADHQGLAISLYDYGASIMIDVISVATSLRGRGIATDALNALCDYADDNHRILTLSPSASFGSDVARLVSWYQEFGFTVNTNPMFAETMIRFPEDPF